jgi:hypothetical protein
MDWSPSDFLPPELIPHEKRDDKITAMNTLIITEKAFGYVMI